MAETPRGAGALLEKLAEFERLATSLEVPMSERLGILNVSEDVYTTLRAGQWPATEEVRPELDRRLTYALPLMRRLASAAPGRAGASKVPDVGMRAA